MGGGGDGDANIGRLLLLPLGHCTAHRVRLHRSSACSAAPMAVWLRIV